MLRAYTYFRAKFAATSYTHIYTHVIPLLLHNLTTYLRATSLAFALALALTAQFVTIFTRLQQMKTWHVGGSIFAFTLRTHAHAYVCCVVAHSQIVATSLK